MATAAMDPTLLQGKIKKPGPGVQSSAAKKAATQSCKK